MSIPPTRPAVTTGAVSVGAFAGSFILDIFRGSVADDDLGFYMVYGALLLLFGGVGVVVAGRVPSNPIGWIFLGLSLWISLTGTASVLLNVFGSQPQAELAEWIGHWSWIPPVLVPATFVLLLFPDGLPPSPRWRLLAWIAGIGLAGFVVYTMFGEFAGGSQEYGANPYHHEATSTISLMVSSLTIPAVLGSVASVVVRFRRARDMERQQIKWLLYSGIVVLTTIVAASLVGEAIDSDAVDLVVLIAIAFVPVSIGLAILRFRLYDIDRLISRTVSYAVIVLVLGSVYVIGAVWLPTRVLAQESALFVAGTTLAAAALFNPLRRRVMRWVDRRFNRARYDPEQIVADLATRLRDQVDSVRLAEDWVNVVTGTLHPSAVGVWMRD